MNGREFLDLFNQFFRRHDHAADPAEIELGLATYRGMAGCDICHGWMGTGGTPNDLPRISQSATSIALMAALMTAPIKWVLRETT